MKWLFLLLLLIMLGGIILLRYRRQIQTMLQLWQMFRQVRQANKPAEKQIEKRENLKETQLVRCERCGTWTPKKTAISLRSKNFYCSTNCLEKAAKLQSLVD